MGSSTSAHKANARLLLAAAAAIPLVGLTTASAAPLYWDSDGATPGGSGGTTASGTWGSSNFWSSDSAGAVATGAYVAGSTAVFSAGTDVTGASTITVNGTQSATGGLTIEEGNVTVTNGTSPGTVDVGTGIVTVNSGARLITNSSARINVAVGGSYAVNGGTLQTTNTGAAGSFIDADATITMTGGMTVDYQVLNVLNIIQATTAISGTGPFTKTGGGVIAIASAGTWSGATNVNDGELRIRTTANRLPIATDLTVSSPGILNLNSVNQQIGSLTGTGNVGTGTGTLTINGSASTTFNGALKNLANAGAGAVTTGNGRLVKNGTGTITFAGLNDINGSVTLTAGGIVVNAGASLCGPIADLTVNGGTLDLNNVAQSVENLTGTGGTINLGTGHTLTADPIANGTYSGTIAGPGGLTKINVLSGATARTLTLAGNNTYDGATNVNGGILSVGNANALGSTVAGTTVALGAELIFTGAATNFTTSTEAIGISGAGNNNLAALGVLSSATPTIAGPITLNANATVTVAGTATGTFSNANAFTGVNTTLSLTGGAGVGGGGVINGLVSLGGGGITKSQGGTWTLANPSGNTYTGNTAVNAGTLLVTNTSGSGTGTADITVGTAAGATAGNLNIGNGGTGGSVAGNIAFVNTSGNSSVNFNRSDNLSYSGSISGTNGGVTKAGAGILTLGGANTYGGTTAVNAGTLLVNGTHTGGGLYTVTAATLGGTGSTTSAVSLVGGTLAPGASIESLGTGAVTLDATSTFAYELDSTLVNADLLDSSGALSIAAGAALNISDLGGSLLTLGTKFTMLASTSWDGGIFTGYADDSTFTLGLNMFTINYNDTTGGSNFGGGTGPNFVTLEAVPEPASLGLLAAGLPMLMRRRRR